MAGEEQTVDLTQTEPDASRQPIRAIDLTQTEPGAGRQPARGAGPEGVPQRRETIRGVIALVLVVLLGIVIITALVAVIWAPDRGEGIKSLLEVLLPPIVALTGTAMGFYFGGREDDLRS